MVAAPASGLDALVPPVHPRTNGGDDGVQLVAAMRMVATASCRASWRGRQRRKEYGGAPVSSGRARGARLTARNNRTRGLGGAHEDYEDRGGDQGLGGGLTVTET